MNLCKIRFYDILLYMAQDCRFIRLTEDNILSLSPYFHQYAYGICDNTLGAVYQWRDIYVSYYAITDGYLCIRAGYGVYGDCYTIPIGFGPIGAAFDRIECDAKKNGIPLKYCVVPEEALPLLVERYGEKAKIESIRDWADYLYDADAFRLYAGKHLHTQRNHVNRFYHDNPDAKCVVVEDETTEKKVLDFLDAYREQHPEASRLELNELNGARELLINRERLNQTAACLMSEEKVIALSIGEVKGDTLYVHVEKARLDVSGAYPAMAQAFVQLFPTVNSVNREDDGGDEGLRYSKLQYKPRELIDKYLVTIEE